MTTRTKSAFTLLKRVGFAVLLLLSLQAIAQWSDDPTGHIRHSCGIYSVAAGNSSICSDGLGGVFMATGFSTGGWADEVRFWLVHVNADGYLTLRGDECPDMFRVDEPNYGTNFGTGKVRLVPTEPPGSVIVLTERYLLDDLFDPTFIGLVAVKFDTLGLTGFGRVVLSTDTALHAAGRGYEGLWDFEGPWEAQSDLQGGIHFVIRRTEGGRFYNHLSSAGELRYPLPGVRMRGMYLHSDNVGGVFDFWNPPEEPGQLKGQRFNAQGDSVLEEGGHTVMIQGEYQLDITLSASRILYRTRIESAELATQFGYLLDTTMTNLWETEGRVLRVDSASVFVGAILPDKTGGFFHHQEITDSTTVINRYDNEAELIASSAPDRHVLSQADGLGGGYYYEMQGKVWRWQPDMTPAWQDSIIVFDCTSCSSTMWATVENGGLIGLLATSTGYAFYHVNPDGSLGPNTDVGPESPMIPSDFDISVFPNPFNPTTTLTFSLPKSNDVQLRVFNIQGQEVEARELGRLAAGEHQQVVGSAEWSSGIYFVSLQAGSATQTVKMVMVK